MPTTDFFSGPGFEPEDTPVKKTSPAQQPVVKQPADDDPFAGMQKLDFNFFDDGVPGGADPGDPFDDFPIQRPAAAARPAQPAPFVFDDEPGAAPSASFGGVPETSISPAASASFSGAATASARPAAPAETMPFDFGILEETPAAPPTPAPSAAPLDGYAPLSLDFLDDAEPIAAAPSSAPAQPAAPVPSAAPVRSAAAPKAASFVFHFDDAPVERPAPSTQPAAPAGTVPFDFGILEETPAAPPTPAPSAAPLDGYAPLSLDFLDDAEPADSVPAAFSARPAASVQPAAVPSAPMAQPAAPAPKAASFTFDFDGAPVEQPAAKSVQPAVPAQPPVSPVAPAQPGYSAADAPTMAFTPVALQTDAPTTAFTPVKPDPSVPAEAQSPAPPAVPAQPAPAARAARMAKEKNIGAAVFSALVADDDVPPAPAAQAAPTARLAPGGVEVRPSGWPEAVPRPASGPRAPQPINWHTPAAPAAPAAQAQQQAPRPATAPAQPAAQPVREPQAPAAETPLNFDFEGTQPFDLFDDVPQGGYTAPHETEEAFPDLYDRDPEETEPASRTPRPRARTGGGSGSGGGRPPRKNTAPARRNAPGKTIFAWAGIVLIALLIILYFVFFGGKDGDVAPGASSSAPSGTSQPAQSTPPVASSVAPVEVIPRDEWYMVLANRSSVLPGDFTVAETKTIGTAVVDARMAEALQQMVNDADAAGIKLLPTNGYRSLARQQELWDARVKTLMESGLSQADAEAKAVDYTSAPGTSDHNTGLGLDIVSEDHQTKDAAFADTAAAQWLAEHAADYGFILRYPSNKTEVTGMDYEPWHYRYVGSEQAHKIKDSGLCLEEYLAQ